MPIIELFAQNFIPSIFARTGASGQRKQICTVGHPTRCPALNSGGANFLHRDDGENGAERVDLFFIDIAVRLNGHIAPRQARATCRNDHINRVIRTPCAQLIGNLRAFIGQNYPRRHTVARLGDPRDKRVARFVVCLRARITDRQYSDAGWEKVAFRHLKYTDYLRANAACWSFGQQPLP